MPDTIAFKLNDQPVRLNVDGDRPLLWVLRTDLGLTGTKYGCGEGHCGACSVLVNKVATRSCLLKVKQVKDKEVVTIEGLAKGGKLHPLQKAFMQHDGLQCGFCTPGFLTTITAYLKENPDPTETEAREAISGSLCRCTGYQNIVKSVLRAAEIANERGVSA